MFTLLTPRRISSPTASKNIFCITIGEKTICDSDKCRPEASDPQKHAYPTRMLIVPFPKNHDNQITLNDAIDAQMEEHMLGGQCPMCNAHHSRFERGYIISLPSVLLIQVDRTSAKPNEKIKDHIHFDEILTLPPYLFCNDTGAEASSPRPTYELYAVIYHIGDSVHAGHYKAVVKEADGTWKLVSDATVTNHTFEDIISKKNPMGDVHVLAYRRVGGVIPKDIPPVINDQGSQDGSQDGDDTQDEDDSQDDFQDGDTFQDGDVFQDGDSSQDGSQRSSQEGPHDGDGPQYGYGSQDDFQDGPRDGFQGSFQDSFQHYFQTGFQDALRWPPEAIREQYCPQRISQGDFQDGPQDGFQGSFQTGFQDALRWPSEAIREQYGPQCISQGDFQDKNVSQKRFPDASGNREEWVPKSDLEVYGSQYSPQDDSLKEAPQDDFQNPPQNQTNQRQKARIEVYCKRKGLEAKLEKIVSLPEEVTIPLNQKAFTLPIDVRVTLSQSSPGIETATNSILKSNRPKIILRRAQANMGHLRGRASVSNNVNKGKRARTSKNPAVNSTTGHSRQTRSSSRINGIPLVRPL